MKLSLKNSLLAALIVIFAVCMAVGIASCNKTHNFSDEWSYDNVGHWHACTDSGCDEIADYAEHTETDAGTVIGERVYYTCSVCEKSYYTSTTEGLIYIVDIKNIGNAGVSGVDVKLYGSDGELINTVTSGTNGRVRFRNLTAGTYTAVVDSATIPTGYSIDGLADGDSYTINFTADYREETVTLTPHLITDQSEPTGLSYSLGSVMYDHTFTVYYTDGSSGTISLSGLLEEYDAIMLQFFFTTCNPCIQEFPVIDEVYNTYKASDGSYYYEKVAILEIAYTGNDSFEYFYAFVTNNIAGSRTGYENFAYTYDSYSSFINYFGITGYPTTLMVDRYGVICFWDDNGSNLNLSHWVTLFDTYIGDDYVPDYVTVSSGDDDSSTTTAKPDVEMQESGVIAEEIVTENNYTSISGTSESDTGTFEFTPYYEDGELDEYSWPWLTNDDDTASLYGVTDYIYTSNSNKLGTYAIIVIDVKLEKGQVFMFDYLLSTEEDGDYLYIQIDKVLQAQLSGETSAWDTFYYVAQYSGYYQITLLYQKNASVNEGEDKVYVTNMRLGVLSTAAAGTDTSNDILDVTKAITTADMLYNAATAYTTDGKQDSYYAGTGYPNYVSVYLASDGWYRVDLDGDNKDNDEAEDTDPYLLADLYYTTPWNDTYAVWSIAYVYLYTYDYTDTSTSDSSSADSSGYIDPTSGKGYLYNNTEDCETIENYAWIQNVAPLGYTLVNSELAELLKEITYSYGTNNQQTNENQWLEVCRYYIHYGATSSSHECKSLENLNATYGMTMAEDTNVTLSSADTEGTLIVHAELPEVINPRGFYYSFEVETEGAYLIYTTEGLHDVNGYETDGITYGNNPYIWVTDSTGHSIAENDNYDLSVYNKDWTTYTDSSATAYYNDNAYVYCYLTKGTYMIGCTMSYVYDTGKYDIYGQYLGATYSYLTAAVASDIYTYSYDEAKDTYTYYLPTVFQSYTLGDDGYYYAINDDGTETPIYINMTGITYLNSSYSSYTIEQAINNNAWTGAYGTTMKNYLASAKANTDKAADGSSLTGYVRADETIAELLSIYINGGDSSTDSTYASTAWLLTAYYVRVLNTYSVSSYTVIETD